jgi:hypothetical protein
MFGDSSNGIEEYTTSVTCFFTKCINDVVPTVSVRTYPNQKPWITGNIRTELKTRASVFKERDTTNRQSVNTNIESYYTGSDGLRMWQGLKTITDYKGKTSQQPGQHLSLNVSKTKELIVNYRKRRAEQAPILIEGTELVRVESFKFLGVHITNKVSRSKHTKTVVKRARQHLSPLRRLKRFGMGHQILKKFYNCNIESILTG